MATLLNKVFGTFDSNNTDFKGQIESKAEEDFIKSPTHSLEGNEAVEASLEAKGAASTFATQKDSIQVSDKVEFSSLIADHVDDYDAEREYQLLEKVDAIQNTINKQLREKGLVKGDPEKQDFASVLDILSEDLYSTENNASNSLWGSIQKEHNLPNLRNITAAVHPEIYQTFAGTRHAKFGGMADAHLYPTDLFARWQQSGNIYEFPKHTGGHVTREVMYGREVGSKVTEGMTAAYTRHNKIVTGKFGGKLSGALYIFFAVGIILGRFEIVNWREEQRQRLKYGLRLMDTEGTAATNQTQQEIAEVHKKWLSTYYEEEEEEEEEAEEEEADEE